MKPVTMYEAGDGSIHRDRADAAARDQLIARCAMTENRLDMKPRPDDLRFSGGGGYVQQPPGTRDRLLGWLKSEGANRDSGGPIGRLLHRLWCMDEADREWGQPYFAMEWDRGTQREWEGS